MSFCVPLSADAGVQFFSYYRRFVERFATIAGPLSTLKTYWKTTVTTSHESTSNSHLRLSCPRHRISPFISRSSSIILPFAVAVLLLSLHSPQLFVVSITRYCSSVGSIDTHKSGIWVGWTISGKKSVSRLAPPDSMYSYSNNWCYCYIFNLNFAVTNLRQARDIYKHAFSASQIKPCDIKLEHV